MGEFARHHYYTVDMDKPLKRQSMGILLAKGDAQGDTFVIKVERGGEAFIKNRLPHMKGYLTRSDGVTVLFDEDHLSKDGTVSLTLDKKCYACDGKFTLSVQMTYYPEAETTILIIDGYMRCVKADTYIYPDGTTGNGNGMSWASVPTYWQSHIDSRVDDVNIAMANATGDRSAFLYYTDAHWTGSYQQGVNLLKYLAQNTPVKKVIFGGDIIEKESDLAYVDSWREQVSQLPWHHSVAGNHDDSISDDGTSGDLWGIEEAYKFLLEPEANDYVVRGAKMYYHIDVGSEKTRYLFLDTATGEGNILNDENQQIWLKNKLLTTPAGWHIVAVAHIWRVYSGTSDAGWAMGGKVALDMLDEYNARAGSFAGCTGKVEFCIGGHCHWDADYTSDGGIPVILTECESYYSLRSGLGAKPGTITESSVNAIVADYDAGVVKVIRVGRGNSRTVQLDGSGSTEDSGGGHTPVVPEGDFTNVLTEVGYTENTRYSNSSNADTAASGWDITGYIAAKRGDVIRMVNVDFLDMDGGGGADSRAMIYLYDANKAYLTCSQAYTSSSLMSDAWSAVYGDDGDLVQFTVPTSYASSLTYIRIGARNIDQYSVITVNEAIE